MIDQHALHRSLTSHFKVPKKPAPKSSTQFRPSMHQRLGPPVGQEGSNQSFQNGQQNGLLGECQSSRILWSGILLKWECHQPPLTRTPIHFPTRNKKQDLQKAVDTLLEKGAIEPVHRSHFLGFFFRLFLVPKKTRGLCLVIDLSTLNRHLVIPYLQMETAQTVRAAVRKDKWTASIDMMYALWKKISFYNSFIVPFFSKLYPVKSCILPKFFL